MGFMNSVAEVWFSLVLRPFFRELRTEPMVFGQNRTGTGSACSVLVLEPV